MENLPFDWKTVAVPLAFALGRNLAGWFIKASEDRRFEKWEFMELLKSSIKIGGLTAAASFGLNLAVPQAAGLATLADFLKRELVPSRK